VETKAPPIRLATARDLNYILSSWSRATHSHIGASLFLSKQGPEPPQAVYQRLFEAVQRRIMAKATVTVACVEDDPGTILGYCVFERPDAHPPVLHYVQVKRDLMRKGIASALLAHAGITKDGACVYTFTSPIQGKVKTPEQWMHVPHWLTGDK